MSDLSMDVDEFREFVRNLIDDTSLSTDEKADKIVSQAATQIASAFFLGLDAEVLDV